MLVFGQHWIHRGHRTNQFRRLHIVTDGQGISGAAGCFPFPAESPESSPPALALLSTELTVASAAAEDAYFGVAT
jgi:hypothetical protein